MGTGTCCSYPWEGSTPTGAGLHILSQILAGLWSPYGVITWLDRLVIAKVELIPEVGYRKV